MAKYSNPIDHEAKFAMKDHYEYRRRLKQRKTPNADREKKLDPKDNE
jgi:hypothetical protein